MIGTIGKFGSGKSTLMIQIAAASTYTPPPHSKQDIYAPKYPETVIHRALEKDHWSCFLPEYFQASFPSAEVKPIRVHTHYKDNLVFTEEERDMESKGGCRIQLKPIEEHTRYHSAEDLYGNLLYGGINVVYEPRDYYLPQEVLDRVFSYDLRPQKRSKEAIKAPSSVWWFEFLEALVRIKHRAEFFFINLDEAQTIFPAGRARHEFWHLIGWFSEIMTSFRKSNISMNLGTQVLSDVDYRVANRLPYYIWLRGSSPKPRMSMVTGRLIGVLPKGWAILEEPKERFGRLPFTRIPNQPPIVKTEYLPSGEQQTPTNASESGIFALN